MADENRHTAPAGPPEILSTPEQGKPVLRCDAGTTPSAKLVGEEKTTEANCSPALTTALTMRGAGGDAAAGNAVTVCPLA